MIDLIPRAEVLLILTEARNDAYDHAWQDGGEAAVVLQSCAKRINAIPAIGTCATCGEWTEPEGVPYGNCRYRYAYGLLLTPPDHFCRAWKAREPK